MIPVHMIWHRELWTESRERERIKMHLYGHCMLNRKPYKDRKGVWRQRTECQKKSGAPS